MLHTYRPEFLRMGFHSPRSLVASVVAVDEHLLYACNLEH